MRKTAATSLAIAVVLLCVGWVLSADAIRAHGALRNRLQQARSIACASKLYASGHAGKFPHELPELIPNYMPDGQLLGFLSADKTRALDLEYFGGAESDPADKLLLRVGAERSGAARVIVPVDMSGAIVR